MGDEMGNGSRQMDRQDGLFWGFVEGRLVYSECGSGIDGRMDIKYTVI